MANKTIVKILGKEYTLVGEMDPEQIVQIADYVNSKMIEIQSQMGGFDTAKIATLAAINIAEEYFGSLDQIKRTQRDKTDVDANFIELQMENMKLKSYIKHLENQ
ncbi:MAG: cell division protein ZapA [Clostridia bacterium]|nr:cell division protein ZapA [Clostridia bacterium]